MTKLDSILKSRHITLPTKVSLVKAMAFPVVMCGCESWTIKKAEHQIIENGLYTPDKLMYCCSLASLLLQLLSRFSRVRLCATP